MNLLSTILLAFLLFAAVAIVNSSTYEEDGEFVDVLDVDAEEDDLRRELQKRGGHGGGRRGGHGGGHKGGGYSNFNVTNMTLATCSNVDCGFRRSNDTGVIACRNVTRYWYGSGEESMEMTVCASYDRHLETDSCGPCMGDVIPDPCTACPCTIRKGQMAGEPGVYMQKMKFNRNKTMCVSSAQSISKQLYGDNYVCFDDSTNCPVDDE